MHAVIERTFDAGLVSQVIEGALGGMLDVPLQPIYQFVHGLSRGLSIALAPLCLSGTRPSKTPARTAKLVIWEKSRKKNTLNPDECRGLH